MKTVDELVEYAQQLGLDDESLGDEVEDASQCAAELARETAMDGGLRGQIKYLLGEGYDSDRLSEILAEIANEPEGDS